MTGRSIRWAVVGTMLALSAPVRAEEKPIDVKNLSCEQFLAQPDDIRPMLVAWVHGYTRAGGESWVTNISSAREFVASVTRRCQENPVGSFRYQVMEVAKVVKALKP